MVQHSQGRSSKGGGICVSRKTLKKFMIQEGLWKAKRRKREKIYQRRAGKSKEGELVQVDGSFHNWFEDRRPNCCLIQFVDDATSEILHARFCEQESTNDYFICLEGYLCKHGKPTGLYVGKHSVFRVTRGGEGKGITVFHQALQTLNIGLICAHSSQAKGRVERKHRMLQDRLN